MEDLDKAIAKVIVTFDGEEEISVELREIIVNNVQRKDILAGIIIMLCRVLRFD